MGKPLAYFVNEWFGAERRRYRLNSVDVLSPYLSVKFFEQLAALKPERVFLTTDAGCPRSDLDDVRAMESLPLQSVRLAYCQGISHVKYYVFRWDPINGGEPRRFMLDGSANASEGGFGINDEGYNWCEISGLPQHQHKDIETYFYALRTNGEHVDELKLVDIPCTKLLPSLRLKDDIGSLEAWVQKGTICNAAAPDTDFGRLKVTLLTGNRRKDALSAQLERHGLGFMQQTTIPFDYLHGGIGDESAWRESPQTAGGESAEDESTPIWRSRYCLYTNLGYWTAPECFDKFGHTFHRPDPERRQAEVTLVVSSSAADQQAWIDRFMAILQDVVRRAPETRNQFQMSGSRLDVDYYQRSFSEQLGRHAQRARIEFFQRSYISGYELSPVPPMRESSSLWNEFLSNWAKTLSFELQKQSTRNLLAQRVRRLELVDPAADHDTVLAALRDAWPEHHRTLREFHLAAR